MDLFIGSERCARKLTTETTNVNSSTDIKLMNDARAYRLFIIVVSFLQGGLHSHPYILSLAKEFLLQDQVKPFFMQLLKVTFNSGIPRTKIIILHVLWLSRLSYQKPGQVGMVKSLLMPILTIIKMNCWPWVNLPSHPMQ